LNDLTADYQVRKMSVVALSSYSSDPLRTSRTLLSEARCNDAVAWWRLVSRYSSIIMAWARHAGLQEADAADVLQEVLIAVHRGLRRFQHPLRVQAFRNWLWMITRRKVIDASRRRPCYSNAPAATLDIARDQPVYVRMDPSGQSERSVEYLGRLGDLDALRQKFQPHVWDAFWRTTVDEQPAVEVAAELGMTPGAVRVARHRVLARIRASIAS